MGYDVEDSNIRIHSQPSGAIDATGNRHRGSMSVDDTSTSIGISGVCDLIRAASSQSAFDTAAASAYGTWYTAKPSDFKAAHFRAYAALKGDLGV